MFSCGWFFMDVVYFSLWFILSSLDLLSSSFLHVSSNWVFGGSGLWLNISLLRIPFLEVVFWGYPQLLASLSGSMSEISTVNVCIHTKTKLSPESFLPKKIAVTKKPDLTTQNKTNTGGTNRLPHAKVGHSSTNQSQKRHLAAVGCIWRSCTTFGWPWPTLGATASQPAIDVSKVGRDGSMELMWSEEMLFLVSSLRKGSLRAKKTTLFVWEGMEI